MKTSSLKSNAYLIITALIWGFAFVSQRVGLDHIDPLAFNVIRFALGGLVLIPFVVYNNKKLSKKQQTQQTEKKEFIIAGVVCGLLLCVSSGLQQFGLLYTKVGKSGFITALYIILVPLIGLFLKKRVSINVWVSVCIALVGMYFLCINENVPINRGDILTFIAAIGFALHIIAVDHFVKKIDGVNLSCIQLFVCSAASALLMLFFGESFSLEGISAAWLPILYSGAMSCGIAYTFQVLGQRNTKPAVASLILSFESVFALLGGILILRETPLARELVGAFLMFAAVLLSQSNISFKKEKKLKSA